MPPRSDSRTTHATPTLLKQVAPEFRSASGGELHNGLVGQYILASRGVWLVYDDVSSLDLSSLDGKVAEQQLREQSAVRPVPAAAADGLSSLDQLLLAKVCLAVLGLVAACGLAWARRRCTSSRRPAPYESLRSAPVSGVEAGACHSVHELDMEVAGTVQRF